MPLKEFDVLRLLMMNAGRVMARELLIDRVWGSDYYGDTKTLDVHVKRCDKDRKRPTNRQKSSPFVASGTNSNALRRNE